MHKCLNFLRKKKKEYDPSVDKTQHGIINLENNILNFLGCIIFKDTDLKIISINYIAKTALKIVNDDIDSLFELLDEKYHIYFSSNIEKCINSNKLIDEFDTLIKNIIFIKNDKKVLYDIKIKMITNNTFLLLIYNFNNNDVLFNGKSFNDYIGNINKKITNTTFHKSVPYKNLNNIINDEFGYILCKNENLDIIKINQKMKEILNIDKISSGFELIPDEYIDFHKVVVKRAIQNRTLPKELNKPIKIPIGKGNNKSSKTIYIRMYIDEYNILDNLEVFFYILIYKDIEKENHVNNIINTLYKKNTTNYIETCEIPSPKKLNNVTTLFLDIVHFSNICEKLSSDKVSEWMINVHNIIQKNLKKYAIQKIETKGDCYLCVSGTKFINDDEKSNQMTRIMLFSKDLLLNLKEIKEPETKIRIGIHTGSITVAYIGNSDFIPIKTVYGENVNIAARMEQTAEHNKINVSKVSAELYAKENNKLLDYSKVKLITFKNLVNFESFQYNDNLEIC